MTFARWLPGLALVVVAGSVTVAAFTWPSRASLQVLQAEAADLAGREAVLLERMQALLAADAGVLELPREAVWTRGEAASIEIAVQQALVSAAGDAGLQLVSFGASAPLAETTLPTVAYELEMTGNHEGVARFLAAIETIRPMLAVSYLWLRQLPPDQTQPGAPVSVRITLWGFREPGAMP